MIWHYSCPRCRKELETPWDNIKQEVTCRNCGTVHFAPTPGEDHTAYIAGESWPQEMEEEVVALRGSACIVPGCYREHTTLVPRVPFVVGGRLSVENLLPACEQHASARSQDDYVDWLARLAEPAPGIAPAGITITSTAEDSVKVQTFGAITGVQSIAGQISVPGPFPAGYRLVFAAPFVPGPATRLVLYYEWKLGPNESGRVVLGAWPRADQPDFAKGLRDSKHFTSNEHRAGTSNGGSALLEIVLPESKDELWIAAVWVEAEPERKVMTGYYLATTVDEQESEAF
ncbi:MAG TPA: hypothetical protein VMH22_13035 [bacterium]|nr:hypothetical protein [bacterium]